MKKIKQLLMLPCVLTCIVFMSCKDDVDRTASFKGSYTTTTESLSPPPMAQIKIKGTGQSSEIKIKSFEGVSTLNLTTAPPFSLEGTGTFYAENGDLFHTSFTGTDTPRDDGNAVVVINFVVTGGTGKFKNATGEFTGNTISNHTEPTGKIDFDGYINF